MPVFGRVSPLNPENTAWLVTHLDDRPDGRQATAPTSPQTANRYPRDGVFGVGAVVQLLQRLVEE